MMYRFLFRNVADNREHLVRARDAAAAIKWVEQNLSGEFNCLAQISDASNGSAEVLHTWEPE